MTSVAEGSAAGRSRGRLVVWLLALSLAVNVCFLGAMVWLRVTLPAMPTPQQRMQMIADELTLNPDQRDAFQQFLIEMRRTSRQLREGNAPLVQRAWDELGKPNPDQALIAQLIDQTSDNRRAYQKSMSVALARFLGELTPAQRGQFGELVKRHEDPATKHLRWLIMP